MVYPGSSILCKNKCGYYGNPSWNNYCSRCYRESQNKSDLYARKARELSQTSSRAFANFEAKRKKVARKSSGTIKNILKIQKDNNKLESGISEEALQARTDFYKTLKSWRSNVEVDVSRQIDKLLRDLESKDFSDINKFSEAVKDFYESMALRVYGNNIYQAGTTEQKESLLNSIERFLSVWIYPWAFTPSNTDDEEIDLKLQDRIRSFHWISHKHLDAPIDPYSLQQSRHLESAILHLIRQNEVLPTEAKLDQIVDCCHEIMKALKLEADEASRSSPLTKASNRQSQDNPNNYGETAADAFFPSLIWVVLRANPPLLHSNLQFITRFANNNRVSAGEPAYFFTNLCCAVEFIKKLNHESLGMTEQEFEQQMRDGIPVALHSADAPDVLADTKGRYAAIGQKLESMEEIMTAAEIELRANKRQTADYIVQLRKKCNLQRTVNLDPRELTTPNILCLGPPPPPPPRNNRSRPSQQRQPVANVIDQLRPDESLAAAPCLSPLSANVTPPPPPPRR